MCCRSANVWTQFTMRLISSCSVFCSVFLVCFIITNAMHCKYSCIAFIHLSTLFTTTINIFLMFGVAFALCLVRYILQAKQTPHRTKWKRFRRSNCVMQHNFNADYIFSLLSNTFTILRCHWWLHRTTTMWTSACCDVTINLLSRKWIKTKKKKV